ncbi:MAG TPA: hypothetical protein VGH28_06530 [Polyangiaceae bacterium]
MGIFDFFKKTDNKSEKVRQKPPQLRREVARYAETVGKKRAQNYDRMEAIVELSNLAQPADNEAQLQQSEKGRAQLEEHEATRIEAAGALLKRFDFVMDPTITDQEEKQVAFEGIQAVGPKIIEPLRAYAAKAESLSWPIKILKSAFGDDEEAIVSELLAWLAKWDTEYAKFVDPKVQLLVELEEHKDPRILEATKDFLLDVNETSRFHAVGVALAQQDDAAVPLLIDMFIDEESLRTRNRVCEGFVQRGWSVPEDRRADMRKSLPSEYSIDGEGKIRRKA